MRDFVKHGACNMKVTILVKTLKPFFLKQSRAIYPTPSKNTTEQRKYIHTIEEVFFTRLHAGHTGILPRYLLSAPLKEIICYLFIWLTIQLCLRFSPRHYETLGYFSKHQTTPGVARFSTPWIGSLKQAVIAYIIFFLTFQSIWRLACPNEIV